MAPMRLEAWTSSGSRSLPCGPPSLMPTLTATVFWILRTPSPTTRRSGAIWTATEPATMPTSTRTVTAGATPMTRSPTTPVNGRTWTETGSGTTRTPTGTGTGWTTTTTCCRTTRWTTRTPTATASADNAQALHPFRDANLRAIIERALGKAKGDPISDAEMAGLDALEADSADISDLTGLELATGLTKLRLNVDHGGNRGTQDGGVADLAPLAALEAIEEIGLAMAPELAELSPLAKLRNLKSLRLDGKIDYDSEVSDLSALASLPLVHLRVRHASVADASPLSGLTRLEFLDLFANRLSDISPLAGLANLSFLSLAHNRIKDASPLRGLTNLSFLSLDNTRIADAGELAALFGPTSLPSLTHLTIGWNLLLSANDFLSAFDPGPDFHSLDLSGANLDDLAPLADFMERSGAREWRLDLSSNPFTDLGPLVRASLWEGGGHIYLERVNLDSEAAEGQIAELESLGVTVRGYDPDGAPMAVRIPDPRLRGQLQEASASNEWFVDEPVTQERAARIRDIRAFGQGIADLTGLEAATGLSRAHLASNRISNLSPLLGLGELALVGLDDNPLSEAAVNEQVPELLRQGAEVILSAVSWVPVAGRDGTSRFRTDGYFSARLGAEVGQISFDVKTDRAALAPMVSGAGLLRIRSVRLAGPATVTVTAKTEGAGPVALDFRIVSPKPLPLFLADEDPSGRHGFLRVSNHSGRPDDVRITARDDSGGGLRPRPSFAGGPPDRPPELDGP